GESDPLALAARKAAAALPGRGVVTLGQSRNDLVHLRGPRGFLHLLVARSRSPDADVLPDRDVEEKGLLEDDADLRSQRLLGDLPKGEPVEPHPPALRIVEAENETEHRALAGATRADERHALARAEGQGDAVDARGPISVGERHVVEGDGVAERADGHGAGRVGHAGSLREEVLDPPEPP